MKSPLAALRGWWNTIANKRDTVAENPGVTTGRRLSITTSGVAVTEASALTLSAVWCAVRAISEPIAAMPYHVFQRSKKNREERRDHPVDWLLSMQPNPEMTAFDFWDLMAQHALTWGNGYAEIERNQRGEPAWLWPIEPWRMRLERKANGDLQYICANRSREYTKLDPMNVYHLHGLGDGLSGYSVISMARESIGLGLAMEQFGSAFFGNGATLGAVIKNPVGGPNLSKPAVDAMLAEFNQRHKGARQSFNSTYLDKGLTVDFAGVPPEDAQFLQSRQFSVLEIARWFRVPPHLLYDLSRATFSNIEHQSLEYVTHTLLPWARRIEKQTDIKLFGRVQRGVFYSRLNFEGMLRGDIKSRFEAFAVARQNGWMSANDIRELEDLNPVKGGGDYLVQLNMVPADLLREQAQANIDKINAPPPPVAAPPDPNADPAADPATDPNAPPEPAAKPNAKVLQLAQRFAEIKK